MNSVRSETSTKGLLPFDLNLPFDVVLQRQFLAETKTEIKQQLLDMGIFSLGKVLLCYF